MLEVQCASLLMALRRNLDETVSAEPAQSMTTERSALATLSPTVSCWRFDAFEIDVAARALRCHGTELPLRRKTWQLLCLLAANPFRLLTKTDLIAALWPRVIVVDDSLVQCVLELRRALGNRGGHLVRTVPRGGYRFEIAVEAASPRLRPNEASESADGELLLVWRALAEAQDPSQVASARQRFESRFCESELRADALAGLAMSHVIDVLNRWAACPAWNIALAHEAANESFSIDPASARACHARAHVAMIEGQHVEAFMGFRAALARNPAMHRSRLRMGLIELELGHPERTSMHVQPVLDSAAEDRVVWAQALFIQGMAEFHLARWPEASRYMQHVLDLRPGSGLAHQWLAAIDALGNRPSSSRSHLASFCRLIPGHTVDSLRSTERSRNPVFVRQRDRFYDGLRLAGLG